MSKFLLNLLQGVTFPRKKQICLYIEVTEAVHVSVEREWPQCFPLLCLSPLLVFFFPIQKVCALHAGNEFINFSGEFKYLNETIA